MKTVPLSGYTDTISGRPGHKIEFKVSSESKLDYKARLYRSINADPNPSLGGLNETECDHIFKPITVKSRIQKFFPGSYGKTLDPIQFRAKNSIKFSCRFFPTLIKNKQCLISLLGSTLEITEKGNVSFTHLEKAIELPHILSERKWYEVEGEVSFNGELKINLAELKHLKRRFHSKVEVPFTRDYEVNDNVLIAARKEGETIKDYFNGKIEHPSIEVDQKIIAIWNLAEGMKTTSVPCEISSPLELINYPTRAVTSSDWDGSEMNWNHNLKHYAAIHFHEDDIYDFNWNTDFTFEIPKEMESGIYVMRLTCEDHEDAIPFFVCPAKGTRTSKLCILVSTFTYSIYGNHARPDYSSSWQKKITEWSAYPNNPAEFKEYGLSTYNYHSDGSGICHSSTNRPLFNMRPGYLTFGESKCSGLRHFQADSHLISWFHAKNIPYDIITDNELDMEGIDSIKGYAAVTTGTHPEYHTSNTLDALMEYRNTGGSLNYLGGNGFYWRIARQAENPDILEIRRAEDGIRAWASEPGEYHNSFDGKYGGLWRRNGRPPQQLVGVGFTAQGTFVGMPFKRTNFENDLNWVFDGVEETIIGDFGYSGNGAAGFELDRVDTLLDEGHDIKILAQSFDTQNDFMLVPEEQLTHLTNVSGGPEDDIRRADMVYFNVEGGGSVFSVGSITFCGCLPWNKFENNISRILLNVLSKQLGKEAL